VNLSGDVAIDRDALLATLPPEWPKDLFPEIRERVQAPGKKVVVLDDDPTGTQTVHHLWVLTRWSPDAASPRHRQRR
jgi:hypothetical protein